MSNGQQFERDVLELVTKMGFTAKTTRTTGDGGIDLVAENHQPLTKGTYIIQCKDWTASVGEPAVRDLYGVVMAERANKGILITASSFTAAARRFAEGKPIELIDGKRYAELQRSSGLNTTSGSFDNGHRQAEDTQSEIKALLEKIYRNPSHIIARKRLADLYLTSSNRLARSRAEEHYRYILDHPPTVDASRRLRDIFVYSHWNLAALLFGKFHFGAALHLLHQNWSRMVNNSELRVRTDDFGRFYHYIGCYTEAIKNYKLSLEDIRHLGDDEYAFEEQIAEIEDLVDLAYMGENIRPEDSHIIIRVLTAEGEHEHEVMMLPNPADLNWEERAQVRELLQPTRDLVQEFHELTEEIEIESMPGKGVTALTPSCDELLAFQHRVLQEINTLNECMENPSTAAHHQELLTAKHLVLSEIVTVVSDSVAAADRLMGLDEVDPEWEAIVNGYCGRPASYRVAREAYHAACNTGSGASGSEHERLDYASAIDEAKKAAREQVAAFEKKEVHLVSEPVGPLGLPQPGVSTSLPEQPTVPERPMVTQVAAESGPLGLPKRRVPTDVPEQPTMHRQTAIADVADQPGSTEPVYGRQIVHPMTSAKEIPTGPNKVFPSPANTGKTKTSPCFVATAVYGDPNCTEVAALRRWRDQVLQRYLVGRLFVRTYYQYGETWARWIKPFPLVRAVVRRLLDQLVDRLR